MEPRDRSARRVTSKSLAGITKPLRAFISYSHKDEKFREQFETHLMVLQRQGMIESWDDRLVGAGRDWKCEISRYLDQAALIIILISPDFVASTYCYDIEMARAIERHEEGTALVIPVIVRDVDWSDTPFARLQVLPRGGKAVKQWSDRDSAWKNVIKGIKTAAVQM